VSDRNQDRVGPDTVSVGTDSVDAKSETFNLNKPTKADCIYYVYYMMSSPLSQ
jgi:hypothetical protein